MEETLEQKAQTAPKTDLPLVLEIIPGQAREGVIEIFESYEGKSVTDLVNYALEKDRTVEERQVVDEIRSQLSGGKLLYKSQEINSDPKDYATVETTEAGEKYMYLPIRAIKPQEGGYR